MLKTNPDQIRRVCFRHLIRIFSFSNSIVYKSSLTGFFVTAVNFKIHKKLPTPHSNRRPKVDLTSLPDRVTFRLHSCHTHFSPKTSVHICCKLLGFNLCRRHFIKFFTLRYKSQKPFFSFKQTACNHLIFRCFTLLFVRLFSDTVIFSRYLFYELPFDIFSRYLLAIASRLIPVSSATFQLYRRLPQQHLLIL